MSDTKKPELDLSGIEIPQGPPPTPDPYGPIAEIHERIDRLEEAVAVQLAAIARQHSTVTNPNIIRAQVDTFRRVLNTREPKG